METRFFIYPVHLSGAFLLTSSLSSAFYLVLVRLMKREYEQAARLITACFIDTARPSLIPSLCTHFTRAGIEWRR